MCRSVSLELSEIANIYPPGIKIPSIRPCSNAMGAARSRTSRSARVLFADDDPLVRNAFARLLRARGFIVDLAADGLEALALATEYPYAIVATDQSMPGLSGIELVSCIKPLQPDATFLLVTGVAEVSRLGAAEAGVSAVLGKPWEDGEVVKLVDQALDIANHRMRARLAETDPLVPAAGEFVLLVEDNDFDATVLTHIIESAARGQYRVIRAPRMSDACRLLKARSYAVVLADMNLPDSQGFATLTELQAVAPTTPILVVTGADDETQALRAVQSGAQDYLLKGRFDGDAALRAIRYAVERKRIERRLTELAHFDQLTHLANRTLLADRLERALSRSSRSGKLAALLLVDLDHFKTVNDTYGHEVGDRLLVEVAHRLTGSTRVEDTVARIGGDEFAVLLEDLADVDGARRVAQRMLNAFATSIVIDGNTLPVTPSIGVGVYPTDAGNASELMRRADAALYQAKGAGKNRCRFFGQGSEEQISRRAKIERELLGALDEGRFSLAYQPEVSLESGAVTGYEVFLRWDVREGPQARAREFLSILDESGDIVRVGRWVLAEACAEIARWTDFSGRFSVNVSAREFADPDFVETVQAALRLAAIGGERLEIELPESIVANNLADARTKLPALAELGVGFTVDDFGGARSCLAEMADLPISTVKLHESLVRFPGTERRRAALRATIAAGKALGLRVVAKAIETPEQLAMLEEYGCPNAQGLLFGLPAPATSVRAPRDTEVRAVASDAARRAS
ncbi:MAG TPA: EAL domain-containing protein [Polyangiaceae bacterium]|nr:EAL domain-containing protein [Polyangiaceae bacterium]